MIASTPEPMRSGPPTFIVGCPRSGTTLLRLMLNQHPRMAFPNESHFIPSLYRQCGDPRTDAEATALAARILRTYWIRRWKMDLTAESFAPLRSYAAVVDRLFTALAEREGKVRWGDKTPHYVREIDTLARIFPGCRVIHIIRDGRDVALSWLRTRLEPGNLYTAARYWRQWVAEGREAGGRLPANTYYEVRYEALVAHPEKVMVALCGFVGEVFDPAILRRPPTRPPGPERTVMPRSAEVEGHSERVKRGSVGGWRRAFDSRERQLFESVGGDLLTELGYEVEGIARPVGLMERAFWRSHHSLVWAARRVTDRQFASRLATFISLRG